MAGFKFLPPRITHPELGFALLLPAPGRRTPNADPRYGVVVRLMDKPVEIRVLIEDTADELDQTKGPAASPKVASQLCRDWAATRAVTRPGSVFADEGREWGCDGFAMVAYTLKDAEGDLDYEWSLVLVKGTPALAIRVVFVFDGKLGPAECRSYVDAVLEGGMYWEDPRG